MQIVIAAGGTRGDVQPMVALGAGLKARGHRVRIVAGANFTGWIGSYGLEVYPTIDIEALMRSELGVKWVEAPNPRVQMKYMKQVMDIVGDPAVQADMINSTRDADLLIGGYTMETYLQAVSEKSGIPQISAALQPYRATRSGAASMVALVPRGNSVLNRMMGGFIAYSTWSVLKDSTQALRGRLGLKPHTLRSVTRALGRIPTLMGFSPCVVPRPADWADDVVQTGYWFLDEGNDYQPPVDLMRFLEAGDAPVYVGFGSMSSSDPAATLRMVVEALTQTGQRGVLARGWAGLSARELPDSLYLLDQGAPHDWLFPRMGAVAHHGGAGTTAAGLRAGKPTFIVSHLGDQAYWGRRVHELGAGPKSIPRPKLTLAGLVKGLNALKSPQMAANAAALGECIRRDRGVETAVEWIEGYMRGR